MTCIADRIYETTISGGVGNMLLGGAPSGFLPFSAQFAPGDTVFYLIEDTVSGQWEVGKAEYDGTAIIRDGNQTVLSSSAAGFAVSFSTTEKAVKIVLPASYVNDIKNTFCGSTEPCCAEKGTLWADDSLASSICLKQYNGVQWIEMFCYDANGLVLPPSDLTDVAGCLDAANVCGGNPNENAVFDSDGNLTSSPTTILIPDHVAGDVKYSLQPIDHNNWLLANGSAYDTALYPDLFALLGNNILPDLRGRSPIGAGNAPGLTSRNLLAMGGQESTILSNLNMPPHTHKFRAGDTYGTVGGWSNNSGFLGHPAGGFSSQLPYQSYDNAIEPSGGNGGTAQSFSNMHPYIALNPFIYAT